MIILQLLVILLLPFALFRLEKSLKWAKPIVMAYVLGVIIGNVAPEVFSANLLKEITGISIILAIPLMLFPTRLNQIMNQPKGLLGAYGLAVLATTIAVGAGYFLYRTDLPQIAEISGMVEGVYTGGTVNLNAIGLAFNVPNELMVLLNGYDMAWSGIYLLGIFTILPRLLGKILPAPKPEQISESHDEEEMKLLSGKQKLKSIGIGLLASVVILGAVAGGAILITGSMNELFIVFGVTGLGLLASRIKLIQKQTTHLYTADILMIIFGFSLGAQANVATLLGESTGLLGYFAFTYLVMLAIHLLLARIFKINVHYFLISSVAAIFGPPFIGPVSESLENRQLITPGIIIALIGNAIGTYLGIAVVQLLLN